ncbi:MAG: gamma-glutamylputrescine oxidase [Acidimicrobiaceae bacterium]|nr:gamma-glutamylputrescine oxidase [Acidimicrobiaceae bacterium]
MPGPWAVGPRDATAAFSWQARPTSITTRWPALVGSGLRPSTASPCASWTGSKLALPDIVRRVGSLRTADSEEEMADCERMLAALRADGFDAESYEGPEGVGVLLPADGAFDPLARCRHMAQAARSEGADLFEHTPVSVGSIDVTTPAGRVECDALVIAVDGGLERVVPDLASRVRTARLQMLATEPVPPRFARPVYARWGYDYWQQLPSGAVALGGCRDQFADDEWSLDATPTEPVQRALDRLLAERVGLPEARVTHRWAGCVGYTDDRMPICELVRPGVAVAGGYCGTGNVLGPLCARTALRLALGLPLDELTPLASAGAGPGAGP